MIAKAKSKARTPLASAPYIPAQTRRLRLEVRKRTRSLGRGFTAHLINCLDVAHGINSAVGIALEILNHLQDASTAKAFERFGIGMLMPNLGQMQRVPEGVLHLLGHGH